MQQKLRLEFPHQSIVGLQTWLYIVETTDDFDWGAYLLEGIERYDPSDGELSVSLSHYVW